MDHLAQLKSTIRTSAFGFIAFQNVLAVGIFEAISRGTTAPDGVAIGASIVLALLLCVVVAIALTNYVTQPIQAVWQAVLHLSPTEHGIAAPKPENLRLGQGLVASITSQLYQMATLAESTAATATIEAHDLSHNFIAQNMPLPLFTMDDSETIIFANPAAADYLGIATSDLIGKNIYMVLDMLFPSDETFDSWLKDVKTKSATAMKLWERVRLNVRDGHPERMFDLAGYYNRDNPQKNETMLILFDHTKMYSQDDQAVSFIALSVHELRTPLTLLRGYIEVFEDEIDTSNNPELKDFMLKMRAQSEQLTAFVNNILNVARIDDDQLQLKLQEEDWSKVLTAGIENLALRAKVRGITLHCRIESGLPTVGIDRISILEVLNNFVDNAIKYSGASKVIEIEARLKDGRVETTVTDKGLGIDTGTLPNLFTKFYRDHRNRAQVGGTGLGLYLAKAIVTAHGGTVWVSSKLNEGSTFGFSLVPYAQLTEEAKQNGDQEMVRGAHGWIKNHSLYRR